MYSFPDLEPVCCSMSSSNCCFLTCIQVSQEASKAVWYKKKKKMKEARVLNWDLYEGPRLDKPCHVPLSQGPPAHFGFCQHLLLPSLRCAPCWMRSEVGNPPTGVIGTSVDVCHCPTSTRVNDWILSSHHSLRSRKAMILRYSTYAYFLNKNTPQSARSSLSVFSLILPV